MELIAAIFVYSIRLFILLSPFYALIFAIIKRKDKSKRLISIICSIIFLANSVFMLLYNSFQSPPLFTTNEEVNYIYQSINDGVLKLNEDHLIGVDYKEIEIQLMSFRIYSISKAEYDYEMENLNHYKSISGTTDKNVDYFYEGLSSFNMSNFFINPDRFDGRILISKDDYYYSIDYDVNNCVGGNLTLALYNNSFEEKMSFTEAFSTED